MAGEVGIGARDGCMEARPESREGRCYGGTAMSIPVGSAAKLTYEDYLYFPEDGKRHEVIDGDHVVSPVPLTRHQIILMNLLRLLDPFVRARGFGRVLPAPVDVLLSPTDVVQPDLVFIGRGNLDRLGEANLEGPPDMVVEIVSEGTRKRDEVTKRHLYERYGVREYWIVDPVLEAVKVYRRSAAEDRFERAEERTAEGGGCLATPHLPGLELPLSAVFE